jgi:hypothetical protein
MITILYEYNQNGPGKVIKNLKKGLEKINVLYKENPSEINYEDKVIALQWHPLVNKVNPKNLLIGPNVCTLPIDNEFIMSQNYKKVLVPSDWVKNKYSRWLSEDKICVWPVGIDTEYFSDNSSTEKKFDCLVYYKRRSMDDLKFVTKMLKSNNQSFNIIEYGQYSESHFMDILSQSKYVFLLDSCESQGIAIQEIMSTNTPIFAWDVEYWADRGDEFKFDATSIPYWDNMCGSYETEKEKIENSFNIFLEKFDFFSPRVYILKNINLEDQAQKIIKELYD